LKCRKRNSKSKYDYDYILPHTHLLSTERKIFIIQITQFMVNSNNPTINQQETYIFDEQQERKRGQAMAWILILFLFICRIPHQWIHAFMSLPFLFLNIIGFILYYFLFVF